MSDERRRARERAAMTSGDPEADHAACVERCRRFGHAAVLAYGPGGARALVLHHDPVVVIDADMWLDDPRRLVAALNANACLGSRAWSAALDARDVLVLAGPCPSCRVALEFKLQLKVRTS